MFKFILVIAVLLSGAVPSFAADTDFAQRVHAALEEATQTLEPVSDLEMINTWPGQLLRQSATQKTYHQLAPHLEGYLRSENVVFATEETPAEKGRSYLIRDDAAASSPLNFLASRLSRYGVRLHITPGLLRRSLMGVQERGLINVALPPLNGLTADVVAHEIYHVLLTQEAVRRGLPHLQRGFVVSEPNNPRSVGQYPRFDLSELGAYADSVFRIGESLGSLPPTARSRHALYGLKRFSKYLVDFSDETLATLMHVHHTLVWNTGRRTSLHLHWTTETARLSSLTDTGGRIDINVVAHHRDIPRAHKGIDEAATFEIAVQDMDFAERYLIRNRLSRLIGIHLRLNRQLHAFERLSVEDKIEQRQAPLRYMESANHAWLRLLGVPMDHEAFRFDAEARDLLGCAALLR